jgi:hypothetical protein
MPYLPLINITNLNRIVIGNQLLLLECLTRELPHVLLRLADEEVGEVVRCLNRRSVVVYVLVLFPFTIERDKRI